MRLLPLIVLAVAGCSQPATEDVLGDSSRYLDDPIYRRAALERSLANHDNTYSRQRLASYGLVDHGWDALPVWVPKSRVLDGEDAATVRDGGVAGLRSRPAPTAIWNGTRPTTTAVWIALGRTVFFTYPMRAEAIAEWALSHPSYGDEAHIWDAAELSGAYYPIQIHIQN